MAGKTVVTVPGYYQVVQHLHLQENSGKYQRTGEGFVFRAGLQAAGRVIRSSKDRGVVVLIDKRFSMMRYRSLFPEDWQPVFIHEAAQLEDALKKFWNRSDLSG